MERDDIFNAVVDALNATQQSLPDIAERAGVSPPTLYNWVNGVTISPRLSTLLKVVPEVGMELALLRKGRRVVHVTRSKRRAA